MNGMYLFMRNKIKICFECGKDIKNNEKFCSWNCYSHYRRRIGCPDKGKWQIKKIYNRRCSLCGKIIEPFRPSKNRKFCSINCHNLSQSKNNCTICGEKLTNKIYRNCLCRECRNARGMIGKYLIRKGVLNAYKFLNNNKQLIFSVICYNRIISELNIINQRKEF